MAGISYPGGSGLSKKVSQPVIPAATKVSATQTRNSVAAITGNTVNSNVKVGVSGSSYLAPPLDQSSLLEMARRSNPITSVVKTQSQADLATIASTFKVPMNPNVMSLSASVASTPASASFPKGSKNLSPVGTTPTVIG